MRVFIATDEEQNFYQLSPNGINKEIDMKISNISKCQDLWFMNPSTYTKNKKLVLFLI